MFRFSHPRRSAPGTTPDSRPQSWVIVFIFLATEAQSVSARHRTKTAEGDLVWDLVYLDILACVH